MSKEEVENFLEHFCNDFQFNYEENYQLIDMDGDNFYVQSNLKDYAFTIQIPAFKKVNMPQKRLYQMKYSALSLSNQKEYLQFLIEDNIKQQMYDVYFEKHKDGRIHCHGRVRLATDELMNRYRLDICQHIGIKAPKQQNEVFHYREEFYKEGWEKYILKNQLPNPLDQK